MGRPIKEQIESLQALMNKSDSTMTSQERIACYVQSILLIGTLQDDATQVPDDALLAMSQDARKMALAAWVVVFVQLLKQKEQ